MADSATHGFLAGILTSGVAAAFVTQLFGKAKERGAARQKIMEFLIERRKELSANPELLGAVAFLEQEAHGNATNPPSNPGKMRELPGFLEPIGVYLEYNPDVFRRAYQVFSKEVELCASSRYLWLSDDGLQESQNEHYSTSPYWPSFRQFVASNRRNLAELQLPPAKRLAHEIARRALQLLEA